MSYPTHNPRSSFPARIRNANHYHMRLCLLGLNGSRRIMKQRVSVGYRMAIGSRVIAAVVGGYAVAALCTGCLSLALVRWTDVARSEAVMTATLMSFRFVSDKVHFRIVRFFVSFLHFLRGAGAAAVSGAGASGLRFWSPRRSGRKK